jgi:Fe-S oxidoreductase
MTLLSFYTACVVFPILCMVGLALYLLAVGRNDVILCTECQLCISHCPGRNKGVNAFQGMMWAKTGTVDEQFYQEFDAVCTRCGMCGKDCPRGLRPFSLLPQGEAENVSMKNCAMEAKATAEKEDIAIIKSINTAERTINTEVA